MSVRFTTLLVVSALTLGGCAATVERAAPAGSTAAAPSQPQASMKIPAEAGKRLVLNMQLNAKQAAADTGWPDFKKEWIDITKEQAVGKGMAFTTQEGEAKATGEQGTLVVVRINDYRYVTVGKRMAFGIFTGNAYIDSKVEFRDLEIPQKFYPPDAVNFDIPLKKREAAASALPVNRGTQRGRAISWLVERS